MPNKSGALVGTLAWKKMFPATFFYFVQPWCLVHNFIKKYKFKFQKCVVLDQMTYLGLAIFNNVQLDKVQNIPVHYSNVLQNTVEDSSE